MNYVGETEPTLAFAVAMLIEKHGCTQAEAAELPRRLALQISLRVSELSQRVVPRTIALPAKPE